MLFLLNTRVLEIGAEMAALWAEVEAGVRPAPTAYAGVAMGQQVLFAAGGFEEAHESIVMRVAATIAAGSEANGALFVRPAMATAPAEVAVRLASVPLTTLARLLQLQRDRPLDAGTVNMFVWNLAAAS